MNKPLVIVLIVVAVVAVALGGLFAWKLVESNQLRSDLDEVTSKYNAFKEKAAADIAALEDAKAELENAKASLTKKVKELETRLTDVEQKARAAVAAEMKKLRDELAAAEERARASAKALEEANEQLVSKDKEIAAREKALAEKEQKISELTQAVAEWQSKENAASELAERYKNRLLENKIPLEPERQFRGHVLVVNKEQDFLILDLGTDDMLPVGTKLKVVRDNHLIGTVEVKKLLPEHGKLSVAVVESLVDPANPVRENDEVKN